MNKDLQISSNPALNLTHQVSFDCKIQTLELLPREVLRVKKQYVNHKSTDTDVKRNKTDNKRRNRHIRASHNGETSLMIDNLVTKTTGISNDEDSFFELSKAK